MRYVAGSVVIPFGGESGILARYPEVARYGTQPRGTVQLEVTLGDDSVTCIVPAYALREIADHFDPPSSPSADEPIN